MKSLILVSALLGFMAHADEKTCTVKGMHCQGCTESVHGKLCDETKYSTCDVKIRDEKTETGEIHMVTKDAKDKVDEKAIGAILTDSGYSLIACANGKTAPEAPKAPAKAGHKTKS